MSAVCWFYDIDLPFLFVVKQINVLYELNS